MERSLERRIQCLYTELSGDFCMCFSKKNIYEPSKLCYNIFKHPAEDSEALICTAVEGVFVF